MIRIGRAYRYAPVTAPLFDGGPAPRVVFVVDRDDATGVYVVQGDRSTFRALAEELLPREESADLWALLEETRNPSASSAMDPS